MRTPSPYDISPKETFDIALEIAIEKGYTTLEKKLIFSAEESNYKGTAFRLKDYGGKTICTVYRGEIIDKLNRKSKSRYAGRNVNEQKAVIWAESLGYPVPKKPDGCTSVFLVIIGLFIFIVPGLIILLIVWNNGRQYERDMRALVEKWVDAGKPEPGVKARPVEELEKIEETPAVSPSTETRLEELVSMKEKGLISQEEYDTLRKKTLGL